MMRKFIFSNRFLYRLSRHLSFWIARLAFLVLSSCVADYSAVHGFFSNISDAFNFKLRLMLLSDVTFCYTVIYFLAPRFLFKKKYASFAVSVFVFSVVIFCLATTFIYVYKHSTPAMLFLLLWHNVINFIFVGPVAVCGLFLSIKMLKNWYLKEEEKQLLITANANAEMQLLKAQIHPHFLFNTLNNIYAFTLNKSPVAGEMVLQLSDMMNYMIADCNAEFVLLQQELKMLNDYISLEKVRYGKLDLQVTITGDIANKHITPLLMIPFIENSFKHGTSKMLKEPWINLFIQADENILHFSLTNSKPPNAIKEGNGGIGLNNVKKRLALLYPNNHLLIVEPTENTFTVNMQVPLEKIKKEVVA